MPKAAKPTVPPSDALKGRRILVVEDEYFIADDLRRNLFEHGAAVVGPFATVAEALDVVADGGRLDGAILDVNLRGEMVYPVADQLKAKSIPFLFLTGYDKRTIPARYSNITHCEKPVAMRKLIAALQ
jgi:DNA-binding response OmpR family regulator